MIELIQVEPIFEIRLQDEYHSSDWLSPNEIESLLEIKSSARQQQWKASRWLAKEIIAKQDGIEDLSGIEICSQTGQQTKLRPMILVDGLPTDWNCSISHTDNYVAVALDRSNEIGIDLISKDNLNSENLVSWMTDSERNWFELSDRRDITCGLIWGIKEAAYKATNRGESFHPLKFEVIAESPGYYKIRSFDNLDIEWTEESDYILVTVETTPSRCGSLS